MEINLDEAKNDWLKTAGPFHIRKIAEHYGVFEHLFGKYAFFTPRVTMDIKVRSHRRIIWVDIQLKLAILVCSIGWHLLSSLPWKPYQTVRSREGTASHLRSQLLVFSRWQRNQGEFVVDAGSHKPWRSFVTGESGIRSLDDVSQLPVIKGAYLLIVFQRKYPQLGLVERRRHRSLHAADPT